MMVCGGERFVDMATDRDIAARGVAHGLSGGSTPLVAETLACISVPAEPVH
jgi:hypothetical protein